MLRRLVSGFRRRRILGFFLILLLAFLGWIWVQAYPFFFLAAHPMRLLGGEKNYLILLQNNYELRPTGGFISAFALLTLRNGIPVSLNFEDVYGSVDEHPYVTPPPPMGELLAHPTYRGHTFRDANFSPDFPTSVGALIGFLHRTRPFQQVDGVLALDMGFLENWLRVTGPLSVGGRDFDATHLLEQMSHMVTDIDLHNLEERKIRKSGIKSLAKSLAMRTLLPWKIPEFITMMRENFETKNLLLFFSDDVLERNVLERNWGGALEAPEGGAHDFLAVVDANFGSGKANRYVKRSVFYFVDLESGKSSLDIRYDHSGERAPPLSDDYRSYVRIFVPQNHSVVGVTPLTGSEGGLRFAGKILRVPIQKSGNLHFDYQFPKSLFDDLTYRLRLWKQPGSRSDFYHVSVRIPSGMRVQSDDFEMAENIATFRGFLDEDRTLVLRPERDRFAPRVLEQKLSQINEFNFFWSEVIDPALLNPRDWKVLDSNVKNPAADVLSIERVDVSGTLMKIRTRGMTFQPDEQYRFEISGVADMSGNLTGERIYTFFQRLGQ